MKSSSLEFIVNLIISIFLIYTVPAIWMTLKTITFCDIQELDRKLSFIFVGDQNAHHQKWLNSESLTDCHSIAAFDFANLSGYTQLIRANT